MSNLAESVAEDVKRESLSLLQQTWFVLPNWKWLGLGLALVAGFFLYHLLRIALGHALRRFRLRFAEGHFVALLLHESLQYPLAMIGVVLMWISALEILALPPAGDRFFHMLTSVIMVISFIRIAYMAANAAGERYQQYAKATPNPLDDQIAPLLTRTLKVIVLALGTLSVLQNVGVNVMSILAGLGLGGLALALAAQDTAANLFGSITILFDRPFQLGEFIKVGDSEGEVEELGLRSTRIRAPTKTLITIPNAMMAKEKIENFGARPFRRCRHILGVTYSTPPQRLLEFIDHIRYEIQQHQRVNHDDITVRFMGYSASSLDILVNFFVQAPTVAEELEIQEQILVQILQIAAHDKVEFAFPSQTIYMASAQTSERSPSALDAGSH